MARARPAKSPAKAEQNKRRPGAASAAATSAASQAERIYAVLRALPRGQVATYGQLALLAGIHAGHRVAARALQQCPDGLPWHRVLAKKDARRAKIAVADADHASLQRKRLAAEGVTFDKDGYVVLRQFGWLPVEVSGGARGRSRPTGAEARAQNAQAASQKRAERPANAPETRKSR
jgi:methylated-DNA-protein-cysteine methyltransferase-like protein